MPDHLVVEVGIGVSVEAAGLLGVVRGGSIPLGGEQAGGVEVRNERFAEVFGEFGVQGRAAGGVPAQPVPRPPARIALIEMVTDSPGSCGRQCAGEVVAEFGEYAGAAHGVCAWEPGWCGSVSGQRNCWWCSVSTRSPADAAAVMPSAASSTARQRCGSTPSNAAACR